MSLKSKRLRNNLGFNVFGNAQKEFFFAQLYALYLHKNKEAIEL
jgi:hypothetical protein